MMSGVKTALESETHYKNTVTRANTFLANFRSLIQQKCKELVDLEKPRIELIHSSINQFVVFDMSAEMNNKYDVGNFAKLLETFNPDAESALIDKFLHDESKPFVPEIKQPKFDFVEFDKSKSNAQMDFRQINKDTMRKPTKTIAEVLSDNSLS
jgi:hypothetical protein